MLPRPQLEEKHGPLLDLCQSVMVTPSELARHWRMSVDYLANTRRAGKGIPYIKLGTGKVLYRLSEILAHEIGQTRGAITLERIAFALGNMKALNHHDRERILKHLDGAFPDAERRKEIARIKPIELD